MLDHWMIMDEARQLDTPEALPSRDADGVSETGQVAALAALTGGEPPPPDAAPLAVAAAKLQMIARAQRSGITWGGIASATGAENGKVAKRDAKRLAKRTQRAMAGRAALGGKGS